VDDDRVLYGSVADKAALARRLARIEGQVCGSARMVEDERCCIDLLTQLSAVATALDAVGPPLLDGHARHCVAGALASGDPGEPAAKTPELLEPIQRYAKRR
jgi:DNA-binding FrmR family transcriptional regulator